MQLINEPTLIKNLERFGLHNDTDLLKALALAKEVHGAQIRDSGNSYLEEHIYVVTNNILNRHSNHPKLKTLLIVAILHDIIEDGDIKDGYLSSEFSSEVEKSVVDITKRRVVLTSAPTQAWLYEQMEKNMKQVEGAGEVAQIVKMEDRIQNLQSTIVNPEKKSKYLRMVEEVRNLFIPLAKKMNREYRYEEILEEEASRIENMF